MNSSSLGPSATGLASPTWAKSLMLPSILLTWCQKIICNVITGCATWGCQIWDSWRSQRWQRTLWLPRNVVSSDVNIYSSGLTAVASPTRAQPFMLPRIIVTGYGSSIHTVITGYTTQECQRCDSWWSQRWVFWCSCTSIKPTATLGTEKQVHQLLAILRKIGEGKWMDSRPLLGK